MTAISPKMIFNGIVRRARRSDLENIAHVEESCFTADIGYEKNLLKEHLDKSLRSKKTVLVVAFSRASQNAPSKIAGYGLAEIDRWGRGELIGNAVMPAFRGQGLGRRLIEYRLRALKHLGVKKFVSQIATTNKASIQLAESCGFVKEKLLHHYYGKNRHAYWMSRTEQSKKPQNKQA